MCRLSLDLPWKRIVYVNFYVVQFSTKSLFEDAINKAISGAVANSRPSKSMPRMDSVEYMKMKSDNESKSLKTLEGVREKDEIVTAKSEIHTYENVVLPQDGARKQDDYKTCRDPIYINVDTRKVGSTTWECSLLLNLFRIANARIM